MDPLIRGDISALEQAFDAAEDDARALVDGLSEEVGSWRADSDSWSVAECLDHLATGNRIYVLAMHAAAEGARRNGLMRRRPAQPGLIGRWFVWTFFEPPVNARLKLKAPKVIRPRMSPPIDDAFSQFLTSHNEIRTFLQTYADIDLAGVRFRNPFVRGIRLSLATGLHVLAAHERRHLSQAWRVRREAERERAQHRTFATGC
jgi:DinB superfamily